MKRGVVLGLIALLLLPGCVTYPRSVSLAADQQRIVPKKEVPSFFSYEKDHFTAPNSYEIVLEKEEKNYQIFRVSFSSAFSTDPKNDQVVFHYFRQKNGSPKPMVIILPIMGGGYFFSEYFAKAFAKAGFQAMWLERKGQLFQRDVLVNVKSEEEFDAALRYTREVYRQAVIDTMRVIDWAELRPEVDGGNIGIAGISLGAIMSATVLGVDARLKAGALMLGGGDIAFILSKSEETPIKEAREKVRANLGWSEETFYRKLKELTRQVEPLNYASRIDPAMILQFDAYFDKSVPPFSANLLWEAMGRPERIRLFSGHYFSMVYLPYASAKMVAHFKKIFGE